MGDVISVSTARSFLKISSTADDTMIETIIDAVEDMAARYCQVEFTQKSLRERLDGGGYVLWPKVGPVVRVDSVTDLVTGAAWTDYRVSNDEILYTDAGDERWPDGPQRWRLTYLAGYGVTYSVPAAFELALLNAISRYYNNRGMKTAESQEGSSETWADQAAVMKLFDPFVRRLMF